MGCSEMFVVSLRRKDIYGKDKLWFNNAQNKWLADIRPNFTQ